MSISYSENEIGSASSSPLVPLGEGTMSVRAVKENDVGGWISDGVVL
jgi:hypothetical protein